jgi:L-lysine exporter family protein LysE/ArgO
VKVVFGRLRILTSTDENQIMFPIYIIGMAILVAIIGALPFGLVNLSVLDESHRKGNKAALKIAHGAALIEVMYGLIALSVGTMLWKYVSETQAVRYLILIIPGVVGVFFLLKKNNKQGEGKQKFSGFAKGIFLNLLSVQVLLYWFLAIAYLSALHVIDDSVVFISLFLLGIWLGKMGTLWIYSLLSERIMGRSAFLANNINRVIGIVLLFTTTIQLLR